MMKYRLNKNDLLENVAKLGVPMFAREKKYDVNRTLYEVVKGGDLRLWESFPVLLANANKGRDFNSEALYKLFGNRKDKLTFEKLVALSLAVYRYFDLKFWWLKVVEKQLSDQARSSVNKFLSCLKQDKKFSVTNRRMDPTRVRTAFQNYFSNSMSSPEEVHRTKDLYLAFSLSQVFSPKQKQLFLKKLRGEKLNKTEREYYSRVVKKKVTALANPELHQSAKSLLEQ